MRFTTVPPKAEVIPMRLPTTQSIPHLPFAFCLLPCSTVVHRSSFITHRCSAISHPVLLAHHDRFSLFLTSSPFTPHHPQQLPKPLSARQKFSALCPGQSPFPSGKFAIHTPRSRQNLPILSPNKKFRTNEKSPEDFGASRSDSSRACIGLHASTGERT